MNVKIKDDIFQENLDEAMANLKPEVYINVGSKNLWNQQGYHMYQQP